MKILAVDDEVVILQSLKYRLERKKWQVKIAGTYEEAQQQIAVEEFDVIVCDYQLSFGSDAKNGLHLLSKIRERGLDTPIIMLTGRTRHEITPSSALDSGADDFIKKPYRPSELIARIKAVARRRFAGKKNSTNRVKQGEITIDLDSKRVWIRKREIRLGKVLFLILTKFLRKTHVLISFREFITYLYGGQSNCGYEEGKNRLRVHMTHLKKKLGSEHARHIATVPGAGYVWE